MVHGHDVSSVLMQKSFGIGFDGRFWIRCTLRLPHCGSNAQLQSYGGRLGDEMAEMTPFIELWTALQIGNDGMDNLAECPRGIDVGDKLDVVAWRLLMD